ncbi:hypothetical protein [Streptococcus dentiloxodontae]
MGLKMKDKGQDRLYQLYRHAFQLLEEQIAFYIKEHYSGVSKIEFSPIFIDGDGRFTMFRMHVVPRIYDNYGSRSILGGEIDDLTYDKYGLLHGLSTLDIDVYGNDFIYLSNSATGEEINVSKHDHLPDEAKLSTSKKIDLNLEGLILDGQLKQIMKSDAGSPNVEIHYNLEIQRGDYTEWH